MGIIVPKAKNIFISFFTIVCTACTILSIKKEIYENFSVFSSEQRMSLPGSQLQQKQPRSQESLL